MTRIIKDLVSKLSECYQPIYNYPKLSVNVSRSSNDRLDKIQAIYKSLENYLNRPLNVLDLGCAQGYFSFHLAHLGANVTGIDYSSDNIILCQEIAKENNSYNLSFKQDRIENFLSTLENNQYDIVLGLSVFHHLIYSLGIQYVEDLLEDLGQKIPVGIFEFALNSEPLYWANLLPDNPKKVLNSFAFVHKVGEFSTHLSEIKRPFIIASNQFWWVENSFEKIESFTSNSYNLAEGIHHHTRKYFFSKDKILKLYDLASDPLPIHNDLEIRNELNFYSKNIKIGFSPQHITSGKTKNEAWIVSEKLEGRLLLDVIQNGDSFDAFSVIEDVLKQLILLEKNGLYHTDVRMWNIMLLDNGYSQLIDYGAVINIPTERIWPYNLFISFFIFIYEITTGHIKPIKFLRPIVLNPYQFPEYYRPWIFALWQTPLNEWTFELVFQKFKDLPKLKNDFTSEIFINSWCQFIEKAITNLEMRAHETFIGVDRSLVDHEEFIIKLHNDLIGVYSSVSWKITRPLRWASKIIHILKTHVISFFTLHFRKTLKYITHSIILKKTILKIDKCLPKKVSLRLRNIYYNYKRKRSNVKITLTHQEQKIYDLLSTGMDKKNLKEK